MTPTKEWYLENSHLIAGTDEAGRGPLAGPVVAACVVLHADTLIHGLNDSKKMTSKKREELFPQILESALAVGIGWASSQRIDQINILKASLESMVKAYDRASALMNGHIPFLLVDGNQKIQLSENRAKQWAIIGGDAKWPPIMAASIVAKVIRDRYMLKAAKRYPKYGFESHKGYGTKAHIAALRQHGPSVLHRRTFRPVSELV